MNSDKNDTGFLNAYPYCPKHVEKNLLRTEVSSTQHFYNAQWYKAIRLYSSYPSQIYKLHGKEKKT